MSGHTPWSEIKHKRDLPKLGRIPSPPDERDYKLADYLPTSKGIFERILEVLEKILAAIEGDTPAPPPPAPPSPDPGPTPQPDGWVSWPDAEVVLDQGNYGTCVGNGCAQWGNTLPIDDKFDEKDARAIYYEATVLDGSPDDPDAPGGGQQGATVRSGAKALKNRGRLEAYAFAASVQEVCDFVSQHGPLIIGTDWTNDMFEPDEDGLVTPTGSVAGGHCYVCTGYSPHDQELEFLNSWGAGWGKGGYFYMKVSDFAKLLEANGEAVAAVELP